MQLAEWRADRSKILGERQATFQAVTEVSRSGAGCQVVNYTLVAHLNDDRRFQVLWWKNWHRFLSFLVPFVFDVAMGSLIFAVLLWFHWLFKVGAAAGLKPEYVEGYEVAHYWINYALFVVMGLDFVIRVVARIFRSE